MKGLTSIFEVRLKDGSRIFSRHYEVRKPEQAARRANGQGRILGIRKVRPEDIIGSIESLPLDNIVGKPEKSILETHTLEDILFPRNKKGRFSNGRKRETGKRETEED